MKENGWRRIPKNSSGIVIPDNFLTAAHADNIKKAIILFLLFRIFMITFCCIRSRSNFVCKGSGFCLTAQFF